MEIQTVLKCLAAELKFGKYDRNKKHCTWFVLTNYGSISYTIKPLRPISSNHCSHKILGTLTNCCHDTEREKIEL